MTGAELAERLQGADYWSLFLASDGREVEALWTASGDGAAARELVASAGADPAARFLAAQLLAAHDALPGDLPPAALAEAYVGGLRGATSEVANVWGLPGGPPGPLGARVVALGPAAVPALVDTLGDVTALHFAGSREAAVGNSYEWRAKDAAATLLAEITAQPFEPDQDPARRDASIDELDRSARA